MREAFKNYKWNIIVFLLFAGSAMLRSALGDFPKALRIYPDELRYVDIARSLFQGRGLQIHHLDTDFQKILYSICIMPAFLAKTSAAQIRLIGLINSVLISSSIFPVYALCRKMLMDKKDICVILAFWATLPTLLDSMYFMSEVVYLPLSLWLIYVVWCTWHSENLYERIRWNVLLGLLCYLAYLCKEIALYFVLAYILTAFVRLLIQRSLWKRELVCAVAFAGVFALCFVAMKMTLFYGMHNSYSSFNLSGVRGLSLLQHPEKIGYLLYAFIYDTLYAMIALGVFPVLLPLFYFKKNKKRVLVLPIFAVGISDWMCSDCVYDHAAGRVWQEISPTAFEISGAFCDSFLHHDALSPETDGHRSPAQQAMAGGNMSVFRGAHPGWRRRGKRPCRQYDAGIL